MSVKAETTGNLELLTDTTLLEDHRGTISIQASNITLDCAGHSVISADPGNGIGVSVNHVNATTGITIKNCHASGFTQGFHATLTENITFQNNTATGNWEGFGVRNTQWVTLLDNHAYDNDHGMVAILTQNGLIQNNVIEGSQSHELTLDQANNLQITDNVTNGSGMSLNKASNNELTGNIISLSTDGRVGIGLSYGSKLNLIQNNSIDSVSASNTGISLWDNCTDNTVDNNSLTNLATAVNVFRNSSHNRITNNLMGTSTSRGVGLYEYSNGNTISGNTINTNGGLEEVLLINSSGNVVSNNQISSTNTGISLLSESHNNTISGNTVSGGANAIRLLGGPGFNLIENNTLVGASYHGILLQINVLNNVVHNNEVDGTGTSGIALSGARLTTVSDNQVTNIANIGVLLNDSANENLVQGNTIQFNLNGMVISNGSELNQIANNNFISNVFHIRVQPSAGSNNFSLPEPVGGNYWDTYDEAVEGCNDDFPVDGFCDVSYLFESGEDLLPWTVPNGWLDSDGDGLLDAEDNCPTIYNPDQADINGDGHGDVCVPPDTVTGSVDLGAGSTVGGGSDLKDGVTT
jgi:parallel beta-helix repeat protein